MSHVGMVARNHPQQAVRDSVDDRSTPNALWMPLMLEFGFTLDAAASKRNAKCARFYTRETDGLLHSWRGERVWCNPPFSRLEPWVAKAWFEMRAGCDLIVMLLPANRCEQRFWQQYVEPFRDGDPRDGIRLRTRFLPGRPKFIPPDRETPVPGGRPPFGCVLLIWERVER